MNREQLIFASGSGWQRSSDQSPSLPIILSGQVIALHTAFGEGGKPMNDMHDDQSVPQEQKKQLECDLVMAGGITSGIVYPMATAELAKTYRFRNIGGTSAGAIAAVGTAAAEFGRRRGVKIPVDGRELDPHERMARVPAELGDRPRSLTGLHKRSKKTRLLGMFKAEPETWPLFRIALAAVERTSKTKYVEGYEERIKTTDVGLGNRLLTIGKAVMTSFPWTVVAGGLFGLLACMVLVSTAFDAHKLGDDKVLEHFRDMRHHPGIGVPIYWLLTEFGQGLRAYGLERFTLTATLFFLVTVASGILWWRTKRWQWAATTFSFAVVIFTLGVLDKAGSLELLPHHQAAAALLVLLILILDLIWIWSAKTWQGAIIGTAVITFVSILVLLFDLRRISHFANPDISINTYVGVWLGSVTLIFVTLIGAFAAALMRAWSYANQVLPTTMYGLCSGRGAPDKYGVAGVTDWLYELIQELAGADQPGKELKHPDDPAKGRPVTVGDLWHGEKYDPNQGELPREPRDIQLALMVTDVTRGLSNRFPFMEGWRGRLYFREDEFRQLFPDEVVDWLVRQSRFSKLDENVETEGFHRLPPPHHLPLIMGARMSMSFPFLFRAIPLYTPNWSRTDHTSKHQLGKIWVSDGGLTSNFPIHFFDSPLPSRPTFGITLVDETIEHREVNPDAGEGDLQQRHREENWKRIWMPRKNQQDTYKVIQYNDFEKGGGSLGGFFFATFQTARNWSDTELTLMPGYRDRVVIVKLNKHEGGLNLDMPDEVIEQIGKRGAQAGQLLAARFDPNITHDPLYNEDVQLNWTNHRWARFRMVMAATEQMLRKITHRWHMDSECPQDLPAGVETYKSMLDDQSRVPDYKWADEKQFVYACEAINELIGLVDKWQGDHNSFIGSGANPNADTPRPIAQLRLMAPVDADPQQEVFDSQVMCAHEPGHHQRLEAKLQADETGQS